MAKMNDKDGKALSRRGLLRAAGLGAGLAGAAASALAAGEAQARADAPGKTGRAGDGYRETEHVKSYYAALRS